MCGEKRRNFGSTDFRKGSPPHVRGKVEAIVCEETSPRITPACAGKSALYCSKKPPPQDHPRMCGEKGQRKWHIGQSLGSPPHVRGKALDPVEPVQKIRITPACAGKSVCRYQFVAVCRDHPRMCGEKAKKIPCNKHFLIQVPHISFSFKNILYIVSQSRNALCCSQEMPKYFAKDPNL